MTAPDLRGHGRAASLRGGLRTFFAGALVVAAIGGCSNVSGVDPGRREAVSPSPSVSSAGTGAATPPATVEVREPDVLQMVASVPVRVLIPAIDVDSGMVGLGLATDGTMEVPPRGSPAGWFTGAPTPGELGPAVIAGHVDWAGQEGVFYDLRNLAVGDEITVVRADASSAVFQVTQARQFPKDTFPTDLVYGNLDYAGLRLITCGGSFDRGERSYVDNIVVFAELVGVQLP